MASVSKNVYIDKLDHIVNKYNNVEKNDNNNPKFKIPDIARISKCKSFFANGYGLNWSEEVFDICYQ